MCSFRDDNTAAISYLTPHIPLALFPFPQCSSSIYLLITVHPVRYRILRRGRSRLRIQITHQGGQRAGFRWEVEDGNSPSQKAQETACNSRKAHPPGNLRCRPRGLCRRPSSWGPCVGACSKDSGGHVRGGILHPLWTGQWMYRQRSGQWPWCHSRWIWWSRLCSGHVGCTGELSRGFVYAHRRHLRQGRKRP